jgi:CheY-like chemotaxis protein
LLAFARHQPLRPERFAMGACIADFLPVLRNTAGPSITITASVPEHDPIVEIDPAQFRSTLVNLVSNARDAISGSGNIEITARVKTVIPTIRKHEPVIGQYVAISVMDDGQGIDPAIGDMVFEPFFTTKPLYYGTGLGLSQVFGFCKQSGGNVAIANRPRGGAEVTLYLPIVDSRDSFDDVLVTRAREAELHTANILFVEDNRLVGSSAAQALMDLGYEVVWLEDAESALRTLAAEPDRFDVVVSDIVMPGLSGFDLAKKLKESHPGLPILLTSGYSNDIAHLASMGCEFIEKPYRLVDLAKTMDALLQGSGRNLH